MKSATSDTGRGALRPAVDVMDAAPVFGPTYRWCVVAATMFALGVSLIVRVALASTSAAYAAEHGISLTVLGSLFTSFYIGYFLSNLISGFASDRFGGRSTTALSLVLFGALAYAFGSTTSFTAGLVVQCLMGLVGGMDYSGCMRLLANTFSRRQRATAIGVFLTCVPLSLMLPNLFIPTLLRTAGWQGVYHALGIGTVVIGVAVYVLLRNDQPVRRVRVAGQKPAFLQLMRNGSFLIATFGGFCTLWATWGFTFLINTLLVRGHGLDPVQVGFAVSLFGGVGLIVKPAVGWGADLVRVPKSVLAAGFALLFGVSLTVFGFLDSLTGFAIASAAAGIGAWGSGVIIATLVIEKAGADFAGSSSGVANAVWMLGNSVVSLVVGGAYQYTGSFQVGIMTIAIGPLIGAALLLCMPNRQPVAATSAATA